MIFTGPPGTGKTLQAKLLAYYVLTNGEQASPIDVDAKLRDLPLSTGSNPARRWEIVQFHPSYNYDDFVRGVRIRTENGAATYKVADGPLLEMARRARDSSQPFVLIVDEINRANVAAVLGEMIYALEYRGQPVRLQHEGDCADAFLPKKLYIIGTMNTSDRSVGHLDYAVRRRFAFCPILPSKSVLNEIPDKELRMFAEEKYDAVERLFRGPNSASTLCADYKADDVQPGHSYFLAGDKPDLNRRIKYQVGPLLREYVADGVLLSSSIEQISEIEEPVA
jgi:5-methylcytosine-specific restriction protein B